MLCFAYDYMKLISKSTNEPVHTRGRQMRFQSKMICLRSDSCKLTAELEIETIVSQSLVPYSHGWNVLLFFFFLRWKHCCLFMLFHFLCFQCNLHKCKCPDLELYKAFIKASPQYQSPCNCIKQKG